MRSLVIFQCATSQIYEVTFVCLFGSVTRGHRRYARRDFHVGNGPPSRGSARSSKGKNKKTSIGPYKEVVVQIPALYKGQLSLYVPFIYVNTDAAMASRREIGGYPKKITNIGLEQFGDEWRGYLERDGKRLLSVSRRRGSNLLETPLPADKPVVLPLPFNITFPLPADRQDPGLHPATPDLAASHEIRQEGSGPGARPVDPGQLAVARGFLSGRRDELGGRGVGQRPDPQAACHEGFGFTSMCTGVIAAATVAMVIVAATVVMLTVVATLWRLWVWGRGDRRCGYCTSLLDR
jgi:hypothetical protein